MTKKEQIYRAIKMHPGKCRQELMAMLSCDIKTVLKWCYVLEYEKRVFHVKKHGVHRYYAVTEKKTR